tara:strand:- start:216 stop:1511 length:1296 start_codon:yes stop_codon:yes gene_type:complete
MKYTSLEELYKIYLKYPRISKDSREITNDCIYFALKGENFNGNKFASKAIESGAKYAIIDEPNYAENEQYLLVENVLSTLQELAKYHRSQLAIPFIGITGSNGKTTTKELINCVLSKSFKTKATKGNYNNHIGVPLTLLEVTQEDEIAIIEMGANHQGEIAFLSSISQPDYGLITNIGKAHLEGFGGIEGIKKGKSELYKYIEKNGGKIFINHDDNTLNELSQNLNQIKYGLSNKCYCQGELKESQPTILGQWNCQNQAGRIKAQIFGTYNFFNILAAICIGNYFKVPSEKIDEAINEYVPSNNRSQIIKNGNGEIILDAYNANPSSMETALLNFSKRNGDNKVLILGDMFELGSTSLVEHKHIIEKVKELNFDNSTFVGENFYNFRNDYPQFSFYKNTIDTKEWYQSLSTVDKQILIKGSRGMKLESLLS